MTAWNIRKQQTAGHVDALISEVKLTTLIFSVRAKAGNAWAHRRWACTQLLMSSSSKEEEDGSSAFPWRTELTVCEDIAVKHPRNYYAWTHRLWVCQQLAARKTRAGRALVDELAWANALFQQNVSDRSIAHHCEQVLLLYMEHESFVIRQSVVPSQAWERHRPVLQQLSFGVNLAQTLPGHETIWQHLRTTMRIFLDRRFDPRSAAGALLPIDRACDALEHESALARDGVTDVSEGLTKYLNGRCDSPGPWWSVVCSHLYMCAHTVYSPVAWNAEVQIRCAVTYACDIALCLAARVKKTKPADGSSSLEEVKALHARLVAVGCALSSRRCQHLLGAARNQGSERCLWGALFESFRRAAQSPW